MFEKPHAISTTDSLEGQKIADLLNEKYATASAKEIVRAACSEVFPDRIAAVSSFGAEAAVLLHLISQVAPSTPIIFLETRKHFDETIEYRDAIVERLGLQILVSAFPGAPDLKADDPDGELYGRDTDRCCHVRKTLPMMRALRPYSAYFTGRKRFQTLERGSMQPFEVYGRWVRVNPLWTWDASKVQSHFEEHDLPKHPLVARNYLSVGCAPCTQPVKDGDDERAGRWSGSDKTECGIHITEDGKIVRTRLL